MGRPCTAGVGVVQSRDGQTLLLRPGETVHTPPGQWHWHGALPDRLMTHLAAGESTGDPNALDVEWGDRVTDDEYEGALIHLGQELTPDSTDESA